MNSVRWVIIITVLFNTVSIVGQQIEWRKQLGYYKLEQGPDSKVKYTVTDNLGNVYLGGNYIIDCSEPGDEWSSECHGFFIEKRSPEGNLIWKDTATGRAALHGLTLDSNNFYISFSSLGDTLHLSSGITVTKEHSQFVCSYFLSYDYGGTPVLVKENVQFGSIKNIENIGLAAIHYDTLLLLDYQGNSIWKKKVCEYSYTLYPADSALIVKVNSLVMQPDSIKKYDFNGNLHWAVKLEQFSGSSFRSIASDVSGNIYVGGEDLRKFDKNGNLLWTKTGIPHAYLQALVYDKNNNSLIGSRNKYVEPGYLIVQLDTSGLITNTININSDEVHSISLFENNIYLGGEYHVFESYIEAVAFKINNTPVGLVEYDSKSRLEIYPNPAKDFITVRFNESLKGPIGYDIMNMTGQKIFERVAYAEPNASFQIKVNGLSKGVYVFRFLYNNKISVNRISIE